MQHQSATSTGLTDAALEKECTERIMGSMIIPTLIENRSTVQNNAPRCISSQDPNNNNSENMNDFSLVRIV